MREVLPYLTKSKRERGYSRKYIDTLISLFHEQRLPKEMRTNDAHLIVGVYYGLQYKLGKYPSDIVTYLLRNAIKAHNESVGILNTETTGYHETITKFWKDKLTQYALEHASNDLYVVANDLLESDLGNGGYLMRYYSKKLLKTTEARKEYREPDLRLMN